MCWQMAIFTCFKLVAKFYFFHEIAIWKKSCDADQDISESGLIIFDVNARIIKEIF